MSGQRVSIGLLLLSPRVYTACQRIAMIICGDNLSAQLTRDERGFADPVGYTQLQPLFVCDEWSVLETIVYILSNARRLWADTIDADENCPNSMFYLQKINATRKLYLSVYNFSHLLAYVYRDGLV